LTERTHVAITRDTRSQAGGKLMSSETVDAGAKFVGTIRLINPEAWQVGAMLRALETMQYLGVGSKKTAGYGELDVRVIEIRARKMEKGEWKQSVVEQTGFLQAFPAQIAQMPRRSEKK